MKLFPSFVKYNMWFSMVLLATIDVIE